jgi:hypothetical protein
MVLRILTLLTGNNLPKIQQPNEAASPSTINEMTVADFTRVIAQTGVLVRERCTLGPVREPD